MRHYRFEDWCNNAVSGIGFPPDREKVYRELYAHMEDRYDALRAQLPYCEILWDVPSQDGTAPNDTDELTLALEKQKLQSTDTQAPHIHSYTTRRVIYTHDVWT